MFPKLDDYDTNDLRQLGLYSWNFDFFALKQLIDFNNDSLKKVVKNLCDESIKANNNDEYKKHNDLMMEIQSYHNIEPWMFQSAFLSLYSIFEASLDRYCDMCQEQFKLTMKKEDLKDKGITRAINYLEKVVELKDIRSDNKWSKMLTLDKLRNDIIHRCGLSSKHEKLYKDEFDIDIVDGRIYLRYDNMIRIYESVQNFITFVFSRDSLNKSRTFKLC